MDLKIRPERGDDFPAIRNVHRLAFGRDDEARLVDILRSEGYSRVSMVGEVDAHLVAHVLFSHLSIRQANGTFDALALAPLAVLPEYQNQGIGARLTERGLDDSRAQGHRVVIVLGHPAYYPRFGFSCELARRLDSPYAGESFMALELVDGSLAGVAGKLEYPPPFSAF
jgi:putative acetyltransferase